MNEARLVKDFEAVNDLEADLDSCLVGELSVNWLPNFLFQVLAVLLKYHVKQTRLRSTVGNKLRQSTCVFSFQG